jgi:acetoacetate decarboxylase
MLPSISAKHSRSLNRKDKFIMALKGLQSIDSLRVPIPVDQPPFVADKRRNYVGFDCLAFSYKTDGNLAAKMMPEVFELEDDPICMLAFNSFSYGNPGPYYEVMQSIQCRYRDETFFYLVRLYLNSLVPILAAREWIGFPKLDGHITFDRHKAGGVLSARLERPEGILLASAVFRPDVYVGPMPERKNISWGLRVIPGLALNSKPVVCELVRMETTQVGGTVWTGAGNPYFTGASEVDPLHRLPVKEMVSAFYVRNSDLSMVWTGDSVSLI